MDCSPPGSSANGILQARILEWVAIFFFRGSSQPGIKPRFPALQADSLPSEPPGKPYPKGTSPAAGRGRSQGQLLITWGWKGWTVPCSFRKGVDGMPALEIRGYRIRVYPLTGSQSKLSKNNGNGQQPPSKRPEPQLRPTPPKPS